jgi:hypothetical protein
MVASEFSINRYNGQRNEWRAIMPEKTELVEKFAEYAIPALQEHSGKFPWEKVMEVYKGFKVDKNFESENPNEEFLAAFKRKYLNQHDTQSAFNHDLFSVKEQDELSSTGEEPSASTKN